MSGCMPVHLRCGFNWIKRVWEIPLAEALMLRLRVLLGGAVSESLAEGPCAWPSLCLLRDIPTVEPGDHGFESQI